MNVIKFTDAEVIRGLKGMTKARAPGWDEMHSEMVTVAEEDGARWTVEHTQETIQSTRRYCTLIV